MADIATMRMKALHFWDKHGISAASEAFGVSCRTLYWWRQLLNKEGPEGLIPHSKAPLVRRKKHWHPDVLKEIRRLRTELPNLGKEQIFCSPEATVRTALSGLSECFHHRQNDRCRT